MVVVVVVCDCSKRFLSGLIRPFLTRSHTGGVQRRPDWRGEERRFKNKVAEAENSYWQPAALSVKTILGDFAGSLPLPDQSPALCLVQPGVRPLVERERGV